MVNFRNIEPELLSMITGKLLGDGNMIHDRNKATRLRFTHASKDRGWCLHCYQKLSKYMKLSPPKYRRIYDPRIKAGYTECYYVQSFTWSALEKIKSDWYADGKKRVPFEYIYNYLTPLCLAWWYQDDGHLKKKKDGTAQKIILSTESFTDKERLFLKKVIIEKYNISFSIDKQHRLVLYDQPSILYFLSLVRPYLSPSMKRKDISLSLEEHQFPTKMRTTIYLPTEIILKRPTEQIRNLMSYLPILNQQFKNEKTLQAFLREHLNQINKSDTRGYQIVILKDQLIQLSKMQKRTGLHFSECVAVCYSLLSKKAS